MERGADQLSLAPWLAAPRPLFSAHYLTEVLEGDATFRHDGDPDLWGRLRDIWLAEKATIGRANEAQAEERFIKPVLHELGFDFTVQGGLKFGDTRRQPDYALFLSEEERRLADGLEGEARYERAVAVADAKRFGVPLSKSTGSGGSPHAQIIQYVAITPCDWGILTDGQYWRLYSKNRDLVSGAFYEVDLVALLEADGPEEFAYFARFFEAASFRRDAQGVSFLDRAIGASQARSRKLQDDLQASIFEAVPTIAAGYLDDKDPTPENLGDAFAGALVFLYRVLFCLTAEARGLLPVGNVNYAEYGFDKHRRTVAQAIDRGKVLASHSPDLYNDLNGLFRTIDKGDPKLGVNAFNGGLFSIEEHPYLRYNDVPDALLYPALDRIFRADGEMIDYRDLSERHLGSIYENLLEFELAFDGGELTLVPGPGRHDSGSIYTPQTVVDLIVERTLDPIMKRLSAEVRSAGLVGRAALNHLLSVKVLDPAMGSGHFLVSATESIARWIATDPGCNGEFELDELRALVAERCIYGVDLNPLAVELARVSLWLATATPGKPLAYFSNLRAGNSLVGANLAELMLGEGTLFAAKASKATEALLKGYRERIKLDPSSVSGVHRKADVDGRLRELREPLLGLAANSLAEHDAPDPQAAFNWDLEFPEVFLDPSTGLPGDGLGFDAVIGNPPYIQIQSLDRGFAEYSRQRFAAASGAFDIYVLFVELGRELLADNGRLGYILPNKFMKLGYGKKLRELLAGTRSIDEVIDFGDAQVFAGVTTYTAILLLDRVGRDEFSYRKLNDSSAVGLRDALADPDGISEARFNIGSLGGEPWALLAGEEARVLRKISDGTTPLGKLTHIFQGLITSADPVYIVERRGRRDGLNRVWSKASGAEVLLEDDFLHPLASGVDVGRYAFHPLSSLLIFPYVREAGEMRLATSEELARAPRTWDYLQAHEETLRGREKGKMDQDGWWAFGRHQGLGLHDAPKLGVAATVQNLEVAIDANGGIYFHNVRVNGIQVSEGSLDLDIVLALLNSRTLDYVFRRHSVPHANGYFAANKQFIGPLPIRDPGAAGPGLRDAAGALAKSWMKSHAAREEFLGWLGARVGREPHTLEGKLKLHSFEQHDPAEIVSVLEKSRSLLSIDPTSKSFFAELSREHADSADELGELSRSIDRMQAELDAAVYEVYELSAEQVRAIERDYE